MQKSRAKRVGALLVGLTLVAAACGDDDGDSDTTDAPAASELEEDAETVDSAVEDAEESADSAVDDAEETVDSAMDDAEETVDSAADDADDAAGDEETLIVGSILPETGALAFLGAPMIEGVPLAVADIQAAGGNIEQIEADSATDPDTAIEAANRLLGEGAHVIVGAAASGVSQAILDTLYNSQIPQCSPSNTSPSFAGQDNAEFYFRTVPGDDVVTPIFADAIVADGHQNVAIVARADDYGNALGSLLQEGLEDQGVTTELISYNPDETSFDATVQQVQAANPDAVALIAFSEGAQIIRGAVEAGVSPEVMYGSDGLATVNLPTEVNPDDPNVIDGMTVIGALGDPEFGERLAAETGGDLLYGAHAYDCTIILKLASDAAGSTDGTAIIGEIVNVTSGDNECTTYADCRALLEDGETIAYNGPSGAGQVNTLGESPAAVAYSIAVFTDGAPITEEVVPVEIG